MSDRRTASCDTCGEVREHASRGECFACYRRRKRAEEMSDRHSPGITRDGKRLLRAHSRLLEALADLRVGRTDVQKVRRILTPYLKPVAEYLEPVREREHIEGSRSMTDDEPMHDSNGGDEDD